MLCIRNACLLFAAVLISASDATAQRVQGRVTDQDTGLPVAGAFVTLLEPAGRAITAILTDAAGAYHLTAPAAGSFRVRVERLGHASTTTEPLQVGIEAVVTRDIVVPVDPVKLAELSASTSGRCDLSRELGAQTQALWEEVRKALSVARWAERQTGVPFQAMLFQRTRGLLSKEVFEQETRLQSGYGRAAFLSAPVSDLAARGYIRLLPDNVLQYFALDAAALLSDDFLDTHCFRVVRDARNRAGLVGLGFQPIEEHRLPDITGTLWVDERTSELQHLDFRFTRHLLPVDVPPEQFGGSVAFRRLPNGAWIVQHWWLRMPQLPPTVSTRSTASEANASAGVRLRNAERRGMRIREEGGTVQFIARPGASAAGSATIRGVVYDSLHARPLPGATVFLVSGGRAVVTSARGEFLLRNVAAGEHEVAFVHPAADSLGLPVQPLRVVVPARGTVRVALGIPRQQGCAERPTADGRTAIAGFVVDAAEGAAIPGASVAALWAPAEDSLARAEVPARTRTAMTAENGSFLLCGFEPGATVRLTVATTRVVRSYEIDVAEPGLLRLTLVVR
ncbi:MAG TPA: carboxypeptidase regulatory-like domain-containing protein [Longimicrobiales bacterium]|nr:carboxypeptidase regulatory-like domain-containing protein [Longimicrobiales bacterium]